MFLKPHWTCSYVAARIVVAVRRRLRPNDPWLTAAAIRILDRVILPDMKGVEFGSGSSTLWLAGRCAYLRSVEHNPDWYRKVTANLHSSGVTNVDSRLCTKGKEYESAIDDIQELDFALIDGKRRAATALKAAKRIRPGGMLVLDNADRDIPPHSADWEAVLGALEGWVYVPTSNGVWRTDFWFRPAGTALESRH